MRFVVGLVAGLLTAATAPTDIAGHWASGWIQAAVETGCMGVGSDGAFRPDAPVTRAELAVVVACTAGVPPREFIPAGDSCGGGDVSACIRHIWPDDVEDDAIKVAFCESRLNPWAVNTSSGAAGLFQFVPSSWAVWGGGRDVLDPRANTEAAYAYWQTSGWAPWVCRYAI